MKAIINGKLVYPDHIQEGVILMDSGKIIASGDVLVPGDARIIDAKGAYVGPGLFDIHCHGYAQSGKNPEFYATIENPGAVAKAHLRHGTTSLTTTLGYGFTQEQFLNGVKLCKAEIASGESTIEGIHFEGPFINPSYGANSHKAWTYSEEVCDTIFDAAGDDVLHCTYAPELPNGPALEAQLKKRGIIADIGHTEVTPEAAERAVANGAKIVTHLFDAMGSYRNVNSKGIFQEHAATILLTFPNLYYELICDYRGIHVQPYNIKLAMCTAGEDRIILVTDCVSRVSHNPADYPEDSHLSAPDLNYNEKGQLSGSRLVLSGACQNFMRHCGADIRQAFKCASTNPAKALGLDHKIGSILPGRDANVLIVDENFNVQDVYSRGEAVQQ